MKPRSKSSSFRQDYLARHNSSRGPGPMTELRLLALNGFRTVGKASAFLRPLPDFLVIGGKRCGSTSLQAHLQESPNVPPLFPSKRMLTSRLKKEDTKGVHYFDTFYEYGESWYRSHFPTTLTRRIYGFRGRPARVGEASPYYLFHETAAARASSLVPGAKVLAILRDPVDRAWSHFREQVRRGNEPVQSFADALSLEEDRLGGTWTFSTGEALCPQFAQEHFAYRGQGEYSVGLARWLEHYPKDQILIIFSEHLFQQPAKTLRSVCEFLDLSMPARRAQWRNAAPPSSNSLCDGIRHDLEMHYRPFNEQLEDIVGEPLPWPSRGR